MQALAESPIAFALAGLALGEAAVHRNLAVFPLVAPGSAAPDYLTLDEALERKLARVTEVGEAGRVPELAFENLSAGKVLLVDGDELVGAKQNRVLNLSLLVGAGRKLAIPVSCVERGRWRRDSREFRSEKRSLYARLRAKKMAHVSRSMREGGSRVADQGEIWRDIDAKFCSFEASSSTAEMSALYRSRQGSIDDYARAIPWREGQAGAVFAVDGKVCGIEVFDCAETFRKFLGRLVGSYAMDAIETAEGDRILAPAAEEAARFVEVVKAAAAERFAALGEGEDLRIEGEGVAGAALVVGGRVVHLAGFGRRLESGCQ